LGGSTGAHLAAEQGFNSTPPFKRGLDGGESGRFLDGLADRLAAAGYKTERRISLDGHVLDVVGKRSGIVLAVGNVLTRHVLAAAMDDADVSKVKDFSAQCDAYALNTFQAGFRPLSGGVLVVSVIVSGRFTDDLKRWLQGESPRRHLAALDCPMLVELASHESYLPRMPTLFGRAFVGEIKKIQKLVTD
jgi:hypothetical protein